MVEYTLNLNTLFSSLADETRRDILNRVAKKQLSVGEIAKHYKLTFAAVSKHLKVLEKARLVIKQRRGKEQMVMFNPLAVNDAAEYLRNYEAIWNQRFDALDKLLKKESLKINKKGKRV